MDLPLISSTVDEAWAAEKQAETGRDVRRQYRLLVRGKQSGKNVASRQTKGQKGEDDDLRDFETTTSNATAADGNESDVNLNLSAIRDHSVPACSNAAGKRSAPNQLEPPNCQLVSSGNSAFTLDNDNGNGYGDVRSLHTCKSQDNAVADVPFIRSETIKSTVDFQSSKNGNDLLMRTMGSYSLSLDDNVSTDVHTLEVSEIDIGSSRAVDIPNEDTNEKNPPTKKVHDTDRTVTFSPLLDPLQQDTDHSSTKHLCRSKPWRESSGDEHGPTPSGEETPSPSELERSRVVSDDERSTAGETSASCCSIKSWKSPFEKEFPFPMTPLSTIRYNSMHIALEETKQYMDKIEELSKALENAEAEVERYILQRKKDQTTIDDLNLQRKRDKKEIVNLQANLEEQSISRSDEKNLSNRSLRQLETELTKAKKKNSVLKQRNQTLQCELEFREQNVVELSEQNRALSKEKDRLEKVIQTMKLENAHDSENFALATQHRAKMEAERDELILDAAEQRSQLETHVQTLSESVAELQDTNETLNQRLDQLSEDNAHLMAQLEASVVKVDKLSNENTSRRKTVDTLNSRLVLSEETPTATSAMQNQAMNELRDQLGAAKELNEKYQMNLAAEMERLSIVAEDRNKLKIKCFDLEEKLRCRKHYADGYSTPEKSNFKNISQSVHTPTSQVLAKTLQSELGKGKTVNNRIIELEKALAVAETKLEKVGAEQDGSFIQKELCTTKAVLQHVRDENAQMRASISSLIATIAEFEQLLQDSDRKAHQTAGNVSSSSEALIAMMTELSVDKSDDIKESIIDLSCLEELTTSISVLLEETVEAKNDFEKQALYWKEWAKNAQYLHLPGNEDTNLQKLDMGQADLQKYSVYQPETDAQENRAIHTFGDEQNARLKKDNIERKHDEDMLLHKISQLESELDVCRLNLGKSKDEVEGLRYELLEFESLKNTMEAKIKKVEGESDAASLALEEAKSGLLMVQNKANEYREAAEGAKKAKENAEHSLRLEANRRKQVENDAVNMRNLAESTKEELTECRANAAKAEDVLSTTNHRLEMAEADVKAYRESIENYRAQLEQLQSKLNDSFDQNNKDNKSHQEKIKALEGELITSQRATEKLLKEVQRLEKNLELEKISQKSAQQKSIVLTRKLSEQIEDLKVTRSHDKRIMDDLRNALNQSVADIERLKSSIRMKGEIKGAVEAESSQLEKLNEELLQTKESLAQSKQQLKMSQDELGKLLTLKKDESKVLHEFQEREAKWQTEIAEKDAYVDRLEMLINKEQGEYEEKWNNFCKKKQIEIRQDDEKITLLKSELAASKFESNQKLEALQRELQESQKQLKATRHDLVSVQDTFSEKQEKLGKKNAELVVATERLKEQLLAAETEQKRLQDDVSRFKSSQSELELKLDDKHEEARSFDKNLLDAENRIYESNSKIKEVEVALEESERDRMSLQAELTKAQRKLEQLRIEHNKQLSVRDDCLEAARREFLEVSEELQMSKDDSSSRKEELRTKAKEAHESSEKIQALERRCNRLKDYIGKLTSKCEGWSDSYKRQTCEMKQTREELLLAQRRLSLISENSSVSPAKSKNSIVSSCPDCKCLRRCIAKAGKSTLEFGTLKTELVERTLEISSLQQKLRNAETTITMLNGCQDKTLSLEKKEDKAFTVNNVYFQDETDSGPIQPLSAAGDGHEICNRNWKQVQPKKEFDNCESPLVAAQISNGNLINDSDCSRDFRIIDDAL